MLKNASVAALAPMIGATEALSKTLIGLTNTISSEEKEKMQDKLSLNFFNFIVEFSG